MSGHQASQSQKIGWSFWGGELLDEQLKRYGALSKQVEELEDRALGQVRGAIDESARLAKESWAYGARLSREWREAALDTMRRAWEGARGL
jgi:hypothetical protein